MNMPLLITMHGLRRLLCRLLLAVMLLASTIAAAASSAGSAPPVPMLWKVSGSNGELYLLGSFHMLRADDYPLSIDVERAFQASQRLLFELSPEEVNAAALSGQMLQLAQRADGSRLEEDLDTATLRKLEVYARAHGMSLQTMQGLKTWFLSLSISVAEMAGLGMDPALGLDRHLMDKARSAGKPALGLELGIEQLRMFDAMSPEEQRQMLVEALDSAGDGGTEVLRLHDIWRRGDVDSLRRQMLVEMQRDYPALYRRINVERNQRWLPLLERKLGEHGTSMVVVGALHLLGSDGVVELLRQRGWRVQRICSLCAANKVD
jgi:uncharacterized protein YbaP (TraB family)